MTAEMFALAAIAVVVLLVWTANRLDALEASKAAHMRDALSVVHDPAKTAGGSAGKSYTSGFKAYYVPAETVSGGSRHRPGPRVGFDGSPALSPNRVASSAQRRAVRQRSAPMGQDANPVDEYDRHTLDAIYGNEQGEQPTRAERLP